MINYDAGYKVILWIQQWKNPFLDYFLSGVTALGIGSFYMVAIPLVYWCVDKKFGAKLYFLFLMGIFMNIFIKYYYQMLRPDPNQVRVFFASSGGSYSFPSGHAQGSVAFWGYTMTWVRKRWFTVFAILLIGLMFLSRMYLGLHYYWDVLGGMALGLASLIIFFFLLGLYEKIRPRFAWPAWLIVLAVATFVLYWIFPEQRYAFVFGSLAGFFMGVVLENRFVGFENRARLAVQVKKALLGIGIGVAIMQGLRFLCPEQFAGVFITYGISAFWVSFVAPWCFKKLGWA